MTKYKKLYSHELKNRDYTLYEDNILKNHISPVLYKNDSLRVYLEKIEPIINLWVNSVKKIKLMYRPFMDKNYKNFK